MRSVLRAGIAVGVGAMVAACSRGGDEDALTSSGGGGVAESGGASSGSSTGAGSGAGEGVGTGAQANSGAGEVSSSGEILMHADFAEGSPRVFVQGDVAAIFGGDQGWNNGLDAGRAQVVDEAGRQFLRVTYPAGQYGPAEGGVQFRVPLDSSWKELYLAYRVRFSDNFEWVKGGKLPGLVGGSAPTGCVADDAGFSARMMWREHALPVQYLYFPEKVSSCGDDYDYETATGKAAFQPGTWHQVQHRIRMNTPGQNDGLLQAWLDGELVVDESTLLYQLSEKPYGIDGFYFSTFYGGSDSSWAPASDQTIDFADFVIATGPIVLPGE